MIFFIYLAGIITLFLNINMTSNYQKYWKHHKENYHYQNKKRIYEYKPASKTTTAFNHTISNGSNKQIANRGIWFSIIQLLLIAIGSYCANRLFNAHPSNAWSNLGYYLSLFNYFWILILLGENIGEYYHINGKGMLSIPIQKFIKLAGTIVFILLLNFILIIVAVNIVK